MSTVADWKAGLELGGTIAKWVIELVARYVDGSDDEEVLRVVDILPAEQRADVEAARQREAMRRELEQLAGEEE